MPTMPSSTDDKNSIISTTIPTTADIIYSSSSAADDDIEKQHSSTSSDDRIHDHVDVQYAESQFADLKRRYSNLSRVASANSQRSKGRRLGTADIEKEEARTEEETEEDEFDLEDVLRDRHRREVEHDIKPKHLGIFPKNKSINGRCYF
jgi:hypothetical protein